MRAERGRFWVTILVCVALALLPDADILLLACGVHDHGLAGHRGLSHTPLFALFVGTIIFVVGWRRRWPQPLRTAFLCFLLVASHGVLDMLAQDGRGIMVAWPFSTTRCHLPWRPIPDAPLGLKFFSEIGMRHLAVELLEFLPFTAYAFWPYRSHFENLRRFAQRRLTFRTTA